MTTNAKLSIIAVAVAALAAAILLLTTGDDSSGTPPPSQNASAGSEDPGGGSGGAVDTGPGGPQAGNAEVTRPNTHLLQEGSSGVTVTEFLDFECESCYALFPIMEQLREEYEGEVTFAIRYFPIESHFNAMTAAQAVEAASKQGAFEEMYIKMYETQPEWGEQRNSKRDLFVSFAEELGLDVEQFERDLDDPKTIERVEFDQREGVKLGVSGTPTVFLDGELLQPGPFDQMKAEIDAALEGR